MRVRAVMSRDPVTVEPDAPLRVARELMLTRRVHHLPVVEPTGRLVGVLTDRDLSHAAFLPLLGSVLPWELRRLRAPRVRDLMTWSVVTVEPETELAWAALLMFERRIGSLPVTEGGRLVGIVTDRDVLAALGGRPLPELYLG